VLEDLLSRSPAHGRAAKLLGEILYREGRVAEAIQWWELAVATGDADDAAERLRAARRELEVESGLFLVRTINFDVRGPPDAAGMERTRFAGRHLEEIQEEAGRRLGVFPRERIQVILYPRSAFSAVTDVHGWVAGLFDGKIRIPLPDENDSGESLRRVLRHEFAHWAVHTRAPGVPSWVHEGIAQVFEGESVAASCRLLLRRLEDGGDLPSLATRDLSPRASHTAESIREGYAHAHAFFGWIDATWGETAIARFLDRLEEGRSVEDALLSVTGIPFRELELRFRESL